MAQKCDFMKETLEKKFLKIENQMKKHFSH